jgi:hypothetical protein
MESCLKIQLVPRDTENQSVDAAQTNNVGSETHRVHKHILLAEAKSVEFCVI